MDVDGSCEWLGPIGLIQPGFFRSLLEQLKALAWSIVVCTQTKKNEAAQILERARYLTVAEVAERFHVTPKWLYRHKKQLPHSQPSRKVLLFPEGPIQEWFAGRKMV